MRIPSDRQLMPGTGKGLITSSVPNDQSESSQLISRTIDRRPDLNRTIRHKTEHGFLKALIAHDTSEVGSRMRDSLGKAEDDGKCIGRALFLVVGLFLLCLAGLGSCALFEPEIFRNSKHIVMRGLCVLGLASLMSQVGFLGYLLWNRTVVSHLHQECRRLVLARLESQFKAPPDSIPARKVNGESSGATVSLPSQPV